MGKVLMFVVLAVVVAVMVARGARRGRQSDRAGNDSPPKDSIAQAKRRPERADEMLDPTDDA